MEYLKEREKGYGEVYPHGRNCKGKSSFTDNVIIGRRTVAIADKEKIRHPCLDAT